MATRSTIAVKHEDGTVSQIYCHWDGYLSHNGKLLLEHYNNPLAAEFLVSKGDLSLLGKRVTPTSEHTFDKPEDNVCIYYGRDRGETGCETRVFDNVDDYLRTFQREEYNYYFNGEFWEVETSDREFVTVTNAMTLEA